MQSCDSPPGEGGVRCVTPLDKGLSRSDWGLRQMDFEEILNGGSTNSLGQSKIIRRTDVRIGTVVKFRHYESIGRLSL